MNINVNSQQNTVYISIEDGDYDISKKLSDNIIVDMSKEGKVLGIEVLDIDISQQSNSGKKIITERIIEK